MNSRSIFSISVCDTEVGLFWKTIGGVVVFKKKKVTALPGFLPNLMENNECQHQKLN